MNQQSVSMPQNSMEMRSGEDAETSQMAVPQASLMESFGPSAAELTASGVPASDSNIGEIHSLYQDLFLTDIKEEVERAQQELKSCK